MKKKIIALILAAAMMLPSGLEILADSSTDDYLVQEEAESTEISIDEESSPEDDGTDGTTDSAAENVEENQELEAWDEADLSEGTEMPVDENAEAPTDFSDEIISDPTGEQAEEQTEEEALVYGLTASSDMAELIMELPESDPLPGDAVLKFYAGSQIKELYGYAEQEWDEAAFEESLKDGWKEAYPEENIRYLYPFYIEVQNQEGETLELPEGTQMYLNLSDQNAYQHSFDEGIANAIGLSGEEGFAEISSSDIDIMANNEKGMMIAAVPSCRNGLYSFIQVSDNMEEGTGEDFEDGTEEALMLAAGGTDEGSKGTRISDVDGWTQADSDQEFDSSYLTFRWYNGKSSYQLIGSADSNWKLINFSNTADVWMPLKAGADGSGHGARYNKVLYDYKTASWYDVKYTILSYSSGGTGTYNGTKTAYYPYVGFNRSRISFDFYRFGDIWMKAQIYKSGTNTEVKLNTRMAVWDIDWCQWVAVGPGNAEGKTFAHRYYYADSRLKAKNYFNSDNSLANSYVEATNEGSDGTDKENLAIWDLKNVSNFSVGIGYYNNAAFASDWLAAVYTILKNNDGAAVYGKYNTEGLTNTSSIWSVVDVDGQSPNPPSLQDPIKSVSNNKEGAYTDYNTLGSVSDEYWYQIDCYVPETAESSHQYSSMVLEDPLPAGVEYSGEWSVQCIEKEAAADGLFEFTNQSGMISLSAKQTSLSASDFYGYTYRLRFKVKWNTKAMTPVIDGNKKNYTAQNQTSLVIVRNGTTSTLQSNTVTTKASAIRTGSVTVTKKILEKDITWAHGDPVFRFVLNGTDTDGIQHTYEDYLEYQVGNYTLDANGYAVLSFTFKSIPLGAYTLTEKETQRYQLLKITADTVNASTGGNNGAAMLDETNPDASFTFLNEKTDFSRYSHCDVVRNTITVDPS